MSVAKITTKTTVHCRKRGVDVEFIKFNYAYLSCVLTMVKWLLNMEGMLAACFTATLLVFW